MKTGTKDRKEALVGFFTNGWNYVTLAIVIFFGIFFLYPLVSILLHAVYDTSSHQWDVSQWGVFFGNKYGYYLKTIWNSLKVSFLSALIATTLGTVLAYILRTTKIFGSKIINILLMVSMVTPPFLSSYAWVILLGRAGIITKWLAQIGIQYGGIYGFGGIIFVFSIKLVPLVNLYVGGALKQVDVSLMEASESLGGHGLSRFFRVTFPLILPTVLASATLVFMRVISDFGVPALIGEGYRTLPTLVYDMFTSDVETNEALAAVTCVITIIITTLIFLLQRYISSRKKIEMSSLRPVDPKRRGIGTEIISHILCYGLMILLIFPLVIIILQSFKDSVNVVMGGHWSFASYAEIFQTSSLLKSVGNTFWMSFAALALVVLIGVFIAYCNVRRGSKITRVIDVIANVPYIIPGAVMGIALLFSFNNPPLALIGTFTIMIVNFVIRRMPYTIRSSEAILRQIDLSVEEASESLGCNKFKTFFGITIPMMAPGVASGAVMSWLSIITELSGSIMLYSVKTKTMSIEIFNSISTGYYGRGAALSTILMLVTTITLLLFFKLTGRKEISL